MQDGHDVTLRSIKNCNGNNQIIKISENSSTTVNNKCEVFSYTCADVKTYNRASVSEIDNVSGWKLIIRF